jgi:hypothetical protein
MVVVVPISDGPVDIPQSPPLLSKRRSLIVNDNTISVSRGQSSVEGSLLPAERSLFTDEETMPAEEGGKRSGGSLRFNTDELEHAFQQVRCPRARNAT